MKKLKYLLLLAILMFTYSCQNDENLLLDDMLITLEEQSLNFNSLPEHIKGKALDVEASFLKADDANFIGKDEMKVLVLDPSTLPWLRIR
ncbi:hypothetical protein [uncultured Croceitalea sp.]|uniref:hypothetical protein n=1 Tax=uncultured Croceitalea sp. TaxID=1798908 RepID=UPI00374F1D28